MDDNTGKTLHIHVKNKQNKQNDTHNATQQTGET